jgi:hypothetical protein
MPLKIPTPKPRKPKQPNRYHKRVLTLAATEPVILTHSEKFDDSFSCAGVQLNANVVADCLRHGWLRPNNDGLFPGHTQSFVPT